MAFEALPVDRRGIGSLQRSMTPQAVVDAGITSFGGAEMDFKTAPSVIESVRRFAEGGLYGFTLPQDGYLEAICWWMGRVRSWDVDPSWIVPAQGTIFSVAAVIRMATEPGDAIIVQPPVYYRYEQAARRLGRRTVYNRLRLEGDRYTMDFEDLERLMSDPFGSIDPFAYACLKGAYTPEGLAWLEGARSYIAENYAIVRETVEGALAPAHVFPLEGTFVGWVEWRGLGLEGEELERFLTEEALLVAEPGLEYGDECSRFTRINLAAMHDQTRAAMERLVSAVERLKGRSL